MRNCGKQDAPTHLTTKGCEMTNGLMRMAAVTLFLLVTVFVLPSAVSGDDSLLEDAAGAVVRLHGCHDGICDILGSGTLIHPSGTILTAWHVAAIDPESPSKDIVDYFLVEMTESLQKRPTLRYRAKLVASAPELDLALLQIFLDERTGEILFPDESSGLPDLPIVEDVPATETLRIMGYPSAAGDSISYPAFEQSGFADDGKLLKVQGTLSPGFSGGPALVESEGQYRIAGVVSYTSGDQREVAMIRNVAELHDLTWDDSAIRLWIDAVEIQESVEDGQPVVNFGVNIHALDYAGRDFLVLIGVFDGDTGEPWQPERTRLPQMGNGSVFLGSEVTIDRFVDTVHWTLSVPLDDFGADVNGLGFGVMVIDSREQEPLWWTQELYGLQSIDESASHTRDDAAAYNITDLVPLADGEILRLGRGEAELALYDPTGEWLAVASDSSVWLYDLQDNVEEWYIPSDDWITSLSWSPDGEYLTFGGLYGSVETWSVADKRRADWFVADTDHIESAVWSPDSRSLAVGGWDGAVELRNVDEGASWQLKGGGTGPWMGQLAWSPDGSQLAMSDNDDGRNGLTLWDTETWDILATLVDFPTHVHHMAWSPDGTRLAVAELESVSVWDAESLERLYSLAGSKRDYSYVSWSPDGRQVAAATEAGVAYVWDTDRRQLLYELPHQAGLPDNAEIVANTEWSPEGDQIVTAGGGYVKLWNAEDGALIRQLDGFLAWVYSASWSPDSTRLATTSGDEAVYIWDIGTGRREMILRDSLSNPASVAWSPDGDTVAVGTTDGDVLLWDVQAPRIKKALIGPASSVEGLAWSPDGKMVAAGFWDGTIWIWDSDGVLAFAVDNEAAVSALDWSADGQWIAAGLQSGDVVIWDALDGTTIDVFAEHLSRVTTAAWSPDGVNLLSSSLDGSIHLWSMGKPDEAKNLTVNSDGVKSVVWSPDGLRFASASSDLIFVWDAQTGETVERFARTNEGSFETLQWSPGGRWLASTSEEGDGAVQIWEVTSP